MDRNLERRTDDADGGGRTERTDGADVAATMSFAAATTCEARTDAASSSRPPASLFLPLLSSSLFDLHLLRWNVEGLAFIHGEGKRAIYTFTNTIHKS